MMDVKIVLSREKKYWRYGPGDRVEGKLVVHNPHPVYCSGIRVSLEALVRVNFRNADGNIVTKTENAISPNAFSYVWPINWSWAQITGKFDDEHRTSCLPASKHIFPFNFYYPSTPLPGSFCSEYGSVKHQVSVYLTTPTKNHLLSTHILNFGDYLNLLQDPLALKPVRLEKRKSSFMYSIVHPSSSPLHFTLKMARGYLPGETAKFKFKLVNTTGKHLARVVISFIQKISYHGEKVRKLICSVLDETETTEVDSALSTIWESEFRIPSNIKPTFYKCCIEHQYFIKVQIFSKSNSTRPTLKGHAPIVIGTVRDLDGQEVCGRCRGDVGSEDAVYHCGANNGGRRGRRTSVDALQRGSMDELSGGGGLGLESLDIFSPPPSYSQLSSRAASIDSFLPLYEDAMHLNRRRKSDEADKI